MEIREFEEQDEKRTKKNEQNLRNLWDTIKSTSIHMNVPEGKERKKNKRKTLEEIKR